MADRAPSRRPGAGSRTPTSRPRRIAGTGPSSLPEADRTDLDHADAEMPDAEVPDAEVPDAEMPDAEMPEVEAPDPVSTEVSTEEETEPAKTPAAATGRSTRRVSLLVLALAVLLAVGTWELVSILGHESPDERPVGAVTAEQPVQVDELTVRSVVDQAGQAAVAIGSASWQDYEAGIDAAAMMMTDAFAETYRETKADVKDQVVEQQVDVTVQVDAQGVVRADPNEIVVLVFLTQSTIAGTGPVTPRQYRATVTMVQTDDGWLVSGLDAGDLLDITGGDG